MTWREDINSVRVTCPEDVRRAAEALHNFAVNTANMRAAPSHNIADKRTPVDAEGTILARAILGERRWFSYTAAKSLS
jgi:hypothetical protein